MVLIKEVGCSKAEFQQFLEGIIDKQLRENYERLKF